MPLVRYIGHKDRKEDNVGKSGAVWFGHGDIQDVPAKSWGALSKHPDVWEMVAPSADADASTEEESSEAEQPQAFANMSVGNPEDQDDEDSNVVARPGAVPTPPGVEGKTARAAKGKKA